MIGRIVEVAEDKRYLHVSRGFMVVSCSNGDRQDIGKIPLDDIAAVIANAHGLSYSNNLLVALAERGTPFVLCAANHNTVGMVWPVSGNFQQGKRFDAQIAAKNPINKRLWADIVKAKLAQQSGVLGAINTPTAPLDSLIKKVKTGDPANVEAQGARRYWRALFGEKFRRDKDGSGINSLLNYGYTVLRSATARAVIAAGLHPTLGIHHHNEGNPMRLVDDLMEPFRPIIDFAVWKLIQNGENSLSPDNKRIIVNTLYEDILSSTGNSPTIVCLQRLAVSLAQIYLGECCELDLPDKKLFTPVTNSPPF